MTKESGTPAQRRKRVRIDEEATVIPPKKATEDTASNAARKLLKQAVASHPEPIQDFLMTISKAYNALKSKQRHHKLSMAKLQEDHFIPRSARVQFELTAPDRVKETEKFKQHKSDVDKALLVYQKACKTAISGTATLVDDQIKMDTVALVNKCILNLCHLLILTRDPDNNSPNHHRLAYYMVQHHLDAKIFEYTWTSRTAVQDFIKNDNNLEDHMAIDDAAEPATQEDNIPTIWLFNNVQITFFESMKTEICGLLYSLFVESWDAQLVTYQKKAVDAALAAATKKILETDATDKAAQEVDAEPTIGPKKIKELINNAVKQTTSKLQTEVNKLSEKVQRSKNESRGTPSKPSGAPSSTKNKDAKRNAKQGDSAGSAKGNKNENQKKQEKRPKKGNAPSRGPNAAASQLESEKTTRGRGKPQQNKKRNASKTRSNRK